MYNAYRADVSNNFPGLNNSGVRGPVGAFNLNTTGYLNGVHTIFWIAFDDRGRGDGIGSRFFSISNVGGAPMAADPDLALPTDRSGLLKIGLVPDRDRAEEAEEGFRLKPAPLKRGAPEGGPISVEIEELGFVELRFRPESRIRDGGAAVHRLGRRRIEAPPDRLDARSRDGGLLLDPRSGLPGPARSPFRRERRGAEERPAHGRRRYRP